MGAFESGLSIGAGAAARDFQKQEEQRIAQREAMANLHQQVLQGPNSTPEQQALARTALVNLYEPHEAPSLMARISGMIHGQQPAPTAPAPSAPDVPQAAPTYTNELGDTVPHATDENGAITPPSAMATDLLGVPISDPTVAAAHAQPMHPFASGHPILDRLHEGLDALGNHLKGFAQPVAPPVKPDLNAEFSNYQGPTAVARETADLAGKRAQALADTRGGYGLKTAEVRAGGASDQARYNRAFAAELGKTASELTPDELAQAARENSAAKRRPQVIIEPTTGIANIITQDDDGQPVASPLRDNDGRLFGGFKPNTVTVRDGVYHFIGADNIMHEVPVTTTSTRIFGPHTKTDTAKPTLIPKADPDAIATPIAAAPVSSQAPVMPDSAAAAPVTAAPSGNGPQRRGAAVKNPSTPPISSAAPTYPGKELGPSKLNAQDRGVLEADQQIQDTVKGVLPVLESLKTNGGLGDKAKMLYEWQRYQHGFPIDDPQLKQIIPAVALLQTQGAAPWTRIGRNKYTFKVIQKHLPQPTDTPALLYDKVKWLSDNVIPSNVDATRSPNPTGKSQPTSSKAPTTPTKGGQSLADRLNEALAK